MCIIVYKPEGIAFPEDKVLKQCFEANHDGAGFMVSDGKSVHIRKGYMTFGEFQKALEKARKKYGDGNPYVLHFRISTQAGKRPACTHPYPLSEVMKDLKKLSFDTDVGVAHNGIIDFTSDGNAHHNDTMLFVQRYLSRIIGDGRMTWWKDPWNLEVVQALIGSSRLAVLDRKKHCTLMGTGWVTDGGIYYSNSSYKAVTYSYAGGRYGYYDDDYDDYSGGSYAGSPAYWDYAREHIAGKPTGKYTFYQSYCPKSVYGDSSYCEKCTRNGVCSLFLNSRKDEPENTLAETLKAADSAQDSAQDGAQDGAQDSAQDSGVVEVYGPEDGKALDAVLASYTGCTAYLADTREDAVKGRRGISVSADRVAVSTNKCLFPYSERGKAVHWTWAAFAVPEDDDTPVPSEMPGNMQDILAPWDAKDAEGLYEGSPAVFADTEKEAVRLALQALAAEDYPDGVSTLLSVDTESIYPYRESGTVKKYKYCVIL